MAGAVVGPFQAGLQGGEDIDMHRHLLGLRHILQPDDRLLWHAGQQGNETRPLYAGMLPKVLDELGDTFHPKTDQTVAKIPDNGHVGRKIRIDGKVVHKPDQVINMHFSRKVNTGEIQVGKYFIALLEIHLSPNNGSRQTVIPLVYRSFA